MCPTLFRAPRRGSAAVTVLFSLPVVLGFAALVIDLGYRHLAETQLQNAMDAAAHAAVLELDGTSEGVERATAAAIAVAATNKAGGQTVVLTADDIAIGTREAGTFTAGGDDSEADAVHITSTRTDIPTFLGLVAFHRASLSATAQTTARRPFGGAGEVDCFLPLAIPSCLLKTYGSSVDAVTLQLNAAGVDDVGWARPGASPSASWVKSQIAGCDYDGTVAVGDTIGLDNGVLSSAMSAMATEVSASSTSWDSSVWGTIPSQARPSDISSADYGRTLEGPIFLFDDDSYCEDTGGPFNGTVEVSGFVWAAVFDVNTTGGASEKTIRVRLDTSRTHEVGTAEGGPDYGVTYLGPVTLGG